jgi:predicted TIM-barrel fold metal-dependent hydrolase
MPIDLTKIKAIDVHVHAEVSCHDPEDPVMGQFFDAASAISRRRANGPRCPRSSRSIANSRSPSACSRWIARRHRRQAPVELRDRRIRREARRRLHPLCLDRSAQGQAGAREARDLIENHGVKGFKFHHIMQNIHPAEQVGYAIYEVINHYKLPAIFHTGHSAWAPACAAAAACG